MLFSVVIPTCNRNESLSKCLDMLGPGVQTIDADAYEVIITDDSKDDTAKHLIENNYPFTKWVKGPCKGPAANRNNGAKYAGGEWLVFLDDDCEPGKDLIKAYKNGIDTYKNVRVFEGFINAERAQKHFMEESPINTTGGYLWSCNFMIKKELFIDVLKGFDENYPYAAMEDVDLHYRLKKINEPMQFLNDARVVHPWRLQHKPFETGNKRFSSLLYFLKKFPEKEKDYNAIYFLKAFFNTGSGILKNSSRFKFRGFFKRIMVVWMQLYFALRVSVKNY